MVRVIQAHYASNPSVTGRATVDARVAAAMATVERHRFVPPALQASAYADRPLPIGEGQTISQPYIVALMTELAALDEDDVVLEVGTGSGYQAAVLAEVAAHVYTIEIVGPLGERAAKLLAALGHDNVTTRIGDGYQGWPEHAPFDAIMVTAAPDHVPAPLVEQLAPGGKMIIPVGRQGAVQRLTIVEKDADGDVSERKVLAVSFVPLTGER